MDYDIIKYSLLLATDGSLGLTENRTIAGYLSCLGLVLFQLILQFPLLLLLAHALLNQSLVASPTNKLCDDFSINPNMSETFSGCPLRGIIGLF